MVKIIKDRVLFYAYLSICNLMAGIFTVTIWFNWHMLVVIVLFCCGIFYDMRSRTLQDQRTMYKILKAYRDDIANMQTTVNSIQDYVSERVK
jgi:hypothetical protein